MRRDPHGLYSRAQLNVMEEKSRRQRLVLDNRPDVYKVPGLGWCGPGWEWVDLQMAMIEQWYDKAMREALDNNMSQPQG